MDGHYKISGLSEIAITVFGVFEMVLCIALVLGFWKRFSRGFFLAISIYSVMTPKVLGGYKLFFLQPSEPQILLFPGFAMLACAIAIYWLRDCDTQFSFAKLDIEKWV